MCVCVSYMYDINTKNSSILNFIVQCFGNLTNQTCLIKLLMWNRLAPNFPLETAYFVPTGFQSFQGNLPVIVWIQSW